MKAALRLELLSFRRQWRRVGLNVVFGGMAATFLVQAFTDARMPFVAVGCGFLIDPLTSRNHDYVLLRGVGRTQLLLSSWAVSLILGCAACGLAAIYVQAFRPLSIHDGELLALALLGSLLKASVVRPMQLMTIFGMLLSGAAIIVIILTGRSVALANIYCALIFIPLFAVFTIGAWRSADFVNATGATP